jgi:hypothetical protein
VDFGGSPSILTPGGPSPEIARTVSEAGRIARHILPSGSAKGHGQFRGIIAGKVGIRSRYLGELPRTPEADPAARQAGGNKEEEPGHRCRESDQHTRDSPCTDNTSAGNDSVQRAVRPY